jgi:hypothetical protein
MDQRIESFLADVLALAGEDPDAFRAGVRDALTDCEAIFRAQEPNKRMRDKAAPRRFPPPWSIEELAECFIVRDANGQDEPGRRAAAHLLTRDEARGGGASPPTSPSCRSCCGKPWGTRNYQRPSLARRGASCG